MTVDLYNTTYRNLATDVHEQVRRATYDEDFGQSSWVTGAEYRRLFEVLGLKPDDRVLDVGSGSGGPALFLARVAGCRVTGIDINEAGVQAGGEQARAAGLSERVQFQHVDVSKPLPFADAAFDALVCMDVLCHLPARARIFAEWQRVLAPGGQALVTDPIVVTGLVRKDELATRSSTGHFEFCPPGANERFLREAGLDVKLVEDSTASEADVSKRWHDARQQHADRLIELEGAETFAGLQKFLQTVHATTRERRLSRFTYLAGKPA